MAAATTLLAVFSGISIYISAKNEWLRKLPNLLIRAHVDIDTNIVKASITNLSTGRILVRSVFLSVRDSCTSGLKFTGGWEEIIENTSNPLGAVLDPGVSVDKISFKVTRNINVDSHVFLAVHFTGLSTFGGELLCYYPLYYFPEKRGFSTPIQSIPAFCQEDSTHIFWELQCVFQKITNIIRKKN